MDEKNEVRLKPQILCMFSGGLDSVGMLWQLLTAEKYAGFEIYLHHMHLLNREERAEAEGEAVEVLYREFRKATGRDFKVTENVVEYRFMERGFIYDMDLAAFMSGNICRVNPRITKVAMGRTATDLAAVSSDFQARMDRAQRIFENVLSLEKRDLPERIFPVKAFTKAEIFAMLPETLREAAWSCRMPVYFDDKSPEPCGKCHTCDDLRAMREELEARQKDGVSGDL